MERDDATKRSPVEYRAEEWTAALGSRHALGEGACVALVRRNNAWMLRVFESRSEFDAFEEEGVLKHKEPVEEMSANNIDALQSGVYIPSTTRANADAMETPDRERAAVDEVFGLLGNLMEKEAVVRMTNTTPILISVLDVIHNVKGGSLGGVRAVWANLKSNHPEVRVRNFFEKGKDL